MKWLLPLNYQSEHYMFFNNIPEIVFLWCIDSIFSTRSCNTVVLVYLKKNFYWLKVFLFLYSKHPTVMAKYLLTHIYKHLKSYILVSCFFLREIDKSFDNVSLIYRRLYSCTMTVDPLDLCVCDKCL